MRDRTTSERETDAEVREKFPSFLCSIMDIAICVVLGPGYRVELIQTRHMVPGAEFRLLIACIAN